MSTGFFIWAQRSSSHFVQLQNPFPTTLIKTYNLEQRDYRSIGGMIPMLLRSAKVLNPKNKNSRHARADERSESGASGTRWVGGGGLGFRV